MSSSSVARLQLRCLGHDYLTQRGGAERVALVMAEAFADAPMYTTLYDPGGTFPEFGELDLRASALNRLRAFARATGWRCRSWPAPSRRCGSTPTCS